MLDYTKKTIYMGLDVHKSTYSITVLCDGEIVKRDKIIAEPAVLLEYCRKFKGARIKSAYEAGFCGFHLHRILVKEGIENIVVHPASIEIGSRDVVKTDKRDSLKIATQLAAGRLSCVFIPTERREDKRHLTRLREQFVVQKTRTSCQIKSLLYLHGLIPAKAKPRICNKWLTYVLDLKMDKNLYYCTEKLIQTWRYFDSQIKMVNKQIKSEMKEDGWLEDIYCSIPGIGRISAHKLVNELDDMSEFSNENKLYRYAGVTPREHSSGEHVRQGHITCQGKPIMRKTLVECAWVAIRKDPELLQIFDGIANRVGKKIAIVAIARILLGRIKSCIKKNRFYVIRAAEAAACKN